MEVELELSSTTGENVYWLYALWEVIWLISKYHSCTQEKWKYVYTHNLNINIHSNFIHNDRKVEPISKTIS